MVFPTHAKTSKQGFFFLTHQFRKLHVVHHSSTQKINMLNVASMTVYLAWDKNMTWRNEVLICKTNVVILIFETESKHHLNFLPWYLWSRQHQANKSRYGIRRPVAWRWRPVELKVQFFQGIFLAIGNGLSLQLNTILCCHKRPMSLLRTEMHSAFRHSRRDEVTASQW